MADSTATPQPPLGNVLVAQSGGPSMVINQSLVGIVKEAKACPKVGRILGALHGIRGILNEQFVDLRLETDETLEAVAATPSSALGSVRHKPSRRDCETVFNVLQAHGVKWFFYIGGNDSAETADLLAEYAASQKSDIVCFHVPKTIDNDLRENDHTPGFGSAARFVASAILGDDLDSRALGGVKIDVIMGRNAGFLTASATLAREKPDDSPHLVYLPERPFSPDGFISDILEVHQRLGRCVVAVSEGIRDEKGLLYASKFTSEVDSHGNMQLSGSGALGDALAALVKARSRLRRVRADTFGYLQRSFPGVASATDSAEARKVGEAAFAAALSGEHASGSIAIHRVPGERYAVSFDVVPLSAVARETRSMPDEFIAPSGHDVTEAFYQYARPLVGELPRRGFLALSPA